MSSFSIGRFDRNFQPGQARPNLPGLNACEASVGCMLEMSLCAPKQARDFVDSALCRAHAGRALCAVKLVASAFAAQGALLGSGPARLHLACQVSYIEVTATYPVPEPFDHDPTALRPELEMFDDLSARVVESVSRFSGSGPGDDGWRLWCQIPTGHLPTPEAN